MDNITLTKLALISQRAQKEPKFQFTSLAHLLNEEFLKECYYGLGRDRASGVDGVSWKVYEEHLDENLRVLVERMKAKRYKSLPVKRVYIPKNEHEKRPLGLPALEDKIVQKGISLILGAIYEADFLNCSYGFRPKRDCHQALNVVDKIIMRERINYVIEADIKGYFDKVSHDWMIKFLQVRINDSSFLLLIRRFLKAGYFEAGKIVSTEQGTPQGGNLSPALSNIFLHYVLDLWFAKKVIPRVSGACHMVRYADDFICMVQHAKEAQRIMEALRKRFAKFDLELHPEKTRVISFGRFEREDARKQNRRPNTFDFLGFNHYCGKNRKGKFILFRQTSNKKFRMKCKEMNNWLRRIRNYKKTREWWPVLQAKLRGHYQYYGVSGNMPSLSKFYSLTERMVLKWLNRRRQHKSFNWESFREYRKYYPLPKPRIVHNFYTLSPVE
jgi:group II intron reverse transcriptase/maturase